MLTGVLTVMGATVRNYECPEVAQKWPQSGAVTWFGKVIVARVRVCRAVGRVATDGDVRDSDTHTIIFLGVSIWSVGN
jgi:hypothetical protein